jgi:polar amino acid transport system substrate-binding protein
MASRSRRIGLVALVLAVNVWVWLLAGVLYTLRWYAVTRPATTTPELFPYGELRVGIDASFPPFGVATADDLFGLDVDIARELGERLDLPVRFVNLGYDGLYDSLRVDQVDVLISALLIDPLRHNEVHYSTPYFNAGLVLVSAVGSEFDSMATMPDHALAYQYGSLADAEARRWLRRVLPFETRPYELTEYALDAARLGEADAALVDAISARLYLREYPDWDVQQHYVADNWLALATRRDKTSKWIAINEALHSLIEDGTLEMLIDEWL